MLNSVITAIEIISIIAGAGYTTPDADDLNRIEAINSYYNIAQTYDSELVWYYEDENDNRDNFHYIMRSDNKLQAVQYIEDYGFVVYGDLLDMENNMIELVYFD